MKRAFNSKLLIAQVLGERSSIQMNIRVRAFVTVFNHDAGQVVLKV